MWQHERSYRSQRLRRCFLWLNDRIHRSLLGIDNLLWRVFEYVVVVEDVDRDYDGSHFLHKKALVLQLHLHIVLAVKRRRSCSVLEDPDPVLELRSEIRFLSFDILKAAVKELDLSQIELEDFIMSLLCRDNSLLLQFLNQSLLIISLAAG